MKHLINYFLLLLFIIQSSCSSSDNSADENPTTVPSPSAAILVYPEQNKTCTTGTIINNEQSSILFEWNTSINTTIYDVTLKNLESNALSTISTNDTKLSIIIDRGAPYQWWVTSKANGTNDTAKSETWKFYNEGFGISNYAPFPTEAISPKRGSEIDFTGNVTLEWSGSDPDNDTLNFEVFMDTTSPPTTNIGSTSETSIADVSVQTATIYYWLVVSTDDAGNSSNSEIFEFKVK